MKIEVTNSSGEKKEIPAQVVRDSDLVTTVLIPFLMDGAKAVAFGRAFRCAKDKQPNKKLARTIALGRALKVVERSQGPESVYLGIPLCDKSFVNAEFRYGSIYLDNQDGLGRLRLRSGGIQFVGTANAFNIMSADEIMAGGQIKDDRFMEL